MKAPRNILFPVETINRELDYRLAMAVLASEKNNRIFVGLHETLMRLARRLQGGVYLGKNAIRPHFQNALDDYHLLKNQGFLFIHFDTEGAIYPGDEERWREILYQRLDPRHLDGDDYVCTWGEFQKETYQNLRPACKDNIRSTGHPRFDLYRRKWRAYFASEAAALKARFGDFLLINTNLARANNRMGPDFVFSAYNGYDPLNLESRLEVIENWAHQNEQLSHYVRLVHRLHLVFPKTAVVLRPHPSEDPLFYARVFQGMPNVHVIHEGPVGPWLMASSCMIHDGCTTGLEAHLSETPIINYRRIENPAQESFLPNLFGVKCTNEDEVVEALVELFHGKEPRSSFDDPLLIDHRARRLLHNFRHEAFPMLLDVLREAQEKVIRTSAPHDLTLHTEERFYETIESAKHLLRPLSPRRRQAEIYSRGKFPGFDPKKINEKIRRIESITKRSVRHQVLSRGLLVVEKG